MSRELGVVPTIRLWDLVLLPLQGEISDELAIHMSQDVLEMIHGSHDTRGLIIDVTGLWIMDSHMCSVISRLAAAASLMGVRTVLCGLSAEIAVTLQSMRLEFGEVTTAPTLEEALELLGIGPIREIDDSGSDDPEHVTLAVSEKVQLRESLEQGGI